MSAMKFTQQSRQNESLEPTFILNSRARANPQAYFQQ